MCVTLYNHRESVSCTTCIKDYVLLVEECGTLWGELERVANDHTMIVNNFTKYTEVEVMLYCSIELKLVDYAP